MILHVGSDGKELLQNIVIHTVEKVGQPLAGLKVASQVLEAIKESTTQEDKFSIKLSNDMESWLKFQLENRPYSLPVSHLKIMLDICEKLGCNIPN